MVLVFHFEFDQVESGLEVRQTDVDSFLETSKVRFGMFGVGQGLDAWFAVSK